MILNCFYLECCQSYVSTKKHSFVESTREKIQFYSNLYSCSTITWSISMCPVYEKQTLASSTWNVAEIILTKTLKFWQQLGVVFLCWSLVTHHDCEFFIADSSISVAVRPQRYGHQPDFSAYFGKKIVDRQQPLN